MERAERWSSTASPPSILRLHSVLPQTLSSCIPSVSTHALLGKLERTAVYVHVPQVSLNKCSILKKQNENNSDLNFVSRQQPTASILKHKTPDHNQTEQTSHISHPVPVTFSSSVVDLSSKRHGILKKRSSLDESQIIRRRSCSPDVSLAKTNCSEFKPILKHQRRSSLDEMIRRAQSPDLHPTSILKHNVYRENDREYNNFGCVEPQGILKRKSWSNISETNTGLHVNIATFLPKPTVGGSELVDISEVRPILKKKHSREDSLSCESVCLEPRPILKKKSSLEAEESDERPKKTILKCLQKSLQDRSGYETAAVLSPKKLSMLRNGLTQSTKDFFDRDNARPILKQNNLIRPYFDCDKDVFIRNQIAKGIHPNDIFFRKRAQSVEHVCTSDSESGLLSILSKRRSLESVYLSDTQGERFGCRFISEGISSDLTEDFVSPQCRESIYDLPTTILKIPDRPNVTLSISNRADCQTMNMDLDSKTLMTDTSLTMTRLVQEVNCMEIRSISIANRLAALEQNGRSKWKPQLSSEPGLHSTFSPDSTDGNIFHKTDVAVKQEKLAERLEKLETASEKWKRRVATPDAVQYSIHGKMKVDHTGGFHSAVTSPLIQAVGNELNRGKKIPRAERCRVKRGVTTEKITDTESVTKLKETSFSRRIVEDAKIGLIHPRSDITVAVPRTDDLTFDTFFSGVSVKRCDKDYIDWNESDLDVLKSRSELLVQRRKIPTRGRRLKSKNPLRVLAARTDLRTEYTEIKTGVAERIMKDLSIAKLAKSSSLAVEALAGLASTEDFNAITLKDAARPTENSGTMLSAYKDLMLILVKGRRHVQVRLVEPTASSINSGDNYILVTPTEVYNYVGKYSNVIERTRSAEIALSIQQNKDLGCTANQVVTVSEEKPTCSRNDTSKFWQLLGAEDEEIDVTEAAHPYEDEVYETVVINTNMVYELIDKELVPYTDFWGVIPKIGMLEPTKILVFDFGSEMYIWNGKLATRPHRKLASDMARELWKEGYDYSECTVCPLTAASVIGARKNSTSIENKASARPDWCLLLKVTQHMEPILFKEKFLDWPDFKRIIKTKNTDSKEYMDDTVTVLPFDVNLIIEPNTTPVDLMLEGSHLGRGKEWFDDEFRKLHLITTLGTTVWHIDEYSHTLLNASSVGQFHAGDSYIVRWTYRITMTGQQLSGQPSKYSTIGRDRCAYFIWQGQTASPNEQGTAALLTVELDQEEGPQIQVIQGFESPAFLNLFSGGMVVHSGNRMDQENEHRYRLYICRGTLESEVSLVEVPCTMQSLRSRCSFLLLNLDDEKFYVWHGNAALPHMKENALKAADKLRINCPEETGLVSYSAVEIIEINEEDEPDQFCDALGKTDVQHYLPLKNINNMEYTMRLFHLSSVTGEFKPTELLCAHRADITTPYPFLQIELYQVSQPALFMLDNGNEIWLWQGWWPDSGADDQTGSGAVRWQSERRAAMRTAIQYWQTNHSESTELPISLVWAGLEPLQFTNLFPMWETRDDVAELNIKDGHNKGEVLSIHMELAKLTQSTYPPAELLHRPLPQGVDPTRLELYLSIADFQVKLTSLN